LHAIEGPGVAGAQAGPSGATYMETEDVPPQLIATERRETRAPWPQFSDSRPVHAARCMLLIYRCTGLYKPVQVVRAKLQPVQEPSTPAEKSTYPKPHLAASYNPVYGIVCTQLVQHACSRTRGTGLVHTSAFCVAQRPEAISSITRP
jgi:hypothetical protein